MSILSIQLAWMLANSYATNIDATLSDYDDPTDLLWE